MYLLASRNKKRFKFCDVHAILSKIPRANATDNTGEVSFHIVHWIMDIPVYKVLEVESWS